MKIKTIIIAAILSLTVVGVNAQQRAFTGTDKVGQIGIGLGSYLGSGTYSTTLPTISLGYEAGVIDKLFDENSSLGLGGFVGYGTGKQSLPVIWQTASSVGFKHRFFLLGGRTSVHYQFVDKLDTYGGIHLGYNIASVKYVGPASDVTPTTASVGGFMWGLHAGARYYFAPQIAVFGELGYGISPLTVGLAIKM